MNELREYVDLSGRAIEVGQLIAYAALWDRSATLKYGRVTAKVDRKTWREEVEPTLRVVSVDRSYRGWELQNGGKVITLAFLDRLLVIDETQAPQPVLDLLPLPIAVTPAGKAFVRKNGVGGMTIK